MPKQKILVIVGPTAVGKTDLSLGAARELSAEIISADSMQVYRGMDIGTAKPSPEERQEIPHHLLDVVDPDQNFNVADYVALAEEILADLEKRDVVPLLTGGTGLYINALIDGFLFPDPQPDLQLRARLEKGGREDPEGLFQKLEQVDPTSAKRIHPNDLRRIIRALEVYLRTGDPISVLQRKKAREERPYRPVYIGLNRNRSELYERINKRVDRMLEAGLVEEVQRLITTYPKQPTALQALGYKEIVRYLKGELDLLEAVEILKRDTRRYAKRQLSWFRSNKKIQWHNLSKTSPPELITHICRQWKATV
ncbi:MAG: tRNA (adenosine(37)-N6)-dimethylallyltransferase MiaA [Firmicutes bacterium]|nr:tRNA (adenosine(37)-N6)-dimethylallyltransferase MiaA [Bacillota bacterium]